MIDLKHILTLQLFRQVFFVLIILGVPILGDASSFQVVWEPDQQVVRQSGSQANWQSVNLASTALAATDADHHEGHGGPPKVVFYQVLNFLLFAGLLFYLLKDKIKNFYQNRFDLFQEQFKAAYREREEIESSYKDYQQKLKQISLTSEGQILKARQDASATKARMLDEAGLESKRIQQEAQTLLELEHKREKRFVQAEFVERVIDRIQSEISGSITDEDKKTLIKKFEVSLK